MLVQIRARNATRDEILRFHTVEYHDRIVEESKQSKGGDGGEQCRFHHGGYEIALLACGGLLAAVECVLRNQIDNAYCLIRPPGHHAIANKGMGFCIFNNIALAAMHAKTLGLNVHKIAIVDYVRNVFPPKRLINNFTEDSDRMFIMAMVRKKHFGMTRQFSSFRYTKTTTIHKERVP